MTGGLCSWCPREGVYVLGTVSGSVSRLACPEHFVDAVEAVLQRGRIDQGLGR